MNDQLSLLDSRRLEAESPGELMTAALAWIKANPEAWSWIVRAAQQDSLEIGRVRVKSYIETLRYRSDLPFATKLVKLPNAFSAAFTRVLAEWHPELRSAIPRAASKLDGCVIPPRPARCPE